MSVIEKLDSVLGRLGETSEGHYLSRLANGTSIALEAANFLADHGPAIRQDMIDARRYRFIRLRLWPSDVDEILDEYPAGTNFYDSVEDAAKRIDAAIDAARATGEGEGNG